MNENKKILVVEDEKPLGDAIKFKFEHRDIEANIADSAEDAINLLKKDDFDLIWFDLNLPKMNGVELLKIIKNNPDWKDKKVVIVSVSGSDEIQKKTKEMGVADYLVKSDFKLDDIINRIAAIA